ncbi:hypothetical protein HK101_005164, partial [Irineochytrium annulatum]
MGFAFQRRFEHINDDAVSMLREMLEAAKPYKHEVLNGPCGMGLSRCYEEDARLLAIVEVLLDFRFLPSTSDYFHAKKCLPKTAKVLEEHFKKKGLSMNDLNLFPARRRTLIFIVIVSALILFNIHPLLHSAISRTASYDAEGRVAPAAPDGIKPANDAGQLHEAQTLTPPVVSPDASDPIKDAAGHQPSRTFAGGIPRIIHQSWKTSDLTSDPILSRASASWRANNPSFRHILWTDAECDAFVREHQPKYWESYDKLPSKVMRADFFRYLVVEKMGGVWADIDTECLRPIEG